MSSIKKKAQQKIKTPQKQMIDSESQLSNLNEEMNDTSNITQESQNQMMEQASVNTNCRRGRRTKNKLYHEISLYRRISHCYRQSHGLSRELYYEITKNETYATNEEFELPRGLLNKVKQQMIKIEKLRKEVQNLRRNDFNVDIE